MSDSSGVEIIEETCDATYELDIEEVVINSSSEDEQILEIKEVSPKEKLAKSDLEGSYEILQNCIKEIANVQVSWERIQTVEQAVSLCRDLVTEENSLRIESERLFQENWILRKRIEKIERAKRKRKRKVAKYGRPGYSPVAQKQALQIDKNVPPAIIEVKDEPKTVNNEIITDQVNVDTNLSRRYKNPRKKIRKHPGDTEEEKEFHELEDKIDDLLYEVNKLWNEVKEEEDGENQITTTSEINVINEIPPASSVKTETPPGKAPVIIIKNVRELMDPQYLNANGQTRKTDPKTEFVEFVSSEKNQTTTLKKENPKTLTSITVNPEPSPITDDVLQHHEFHEPDVIIISGESDNESETINQ